MHVVAAGVHAAVGGGKRLAGLLGDGEGVVIGAQQEARIAGPQNGRDARAFYKGIVVGDVHGFELRFDISGRLWQMQADLWHVAQRAPPCAELLLQRARLLEQAGQAGWNVRVCARVGRFVGTGADRFVAGHRCAISFALWWLLDKNHGIPCAGRACRSHQGGGALRAGKMWMLQINVRPAPQVVNRG